MDIIKYYNGALKKVNLFMDNMCLCLPRINFNYDDKTFNMLRISLIYVIAQSFFLPLYFFPVVRITLRFCRILLYN